MVCAICGCDDARDRRAAPRALPYGFLRISAVCAITCDGQRASRSRARDGPTYDVAGRAVRPTGHGIERPRLRAVPARRNATVRARIARGSDPANETAYRRTRRGPAARRGARIRGCQAFRRQGGCAFKPFGGLLLDWAGLLVRSTSTETGLCPLGISSWPRAAQEGESEAPSIACTGCLRNPCRPSKCAPVGAWEFVVVGRSSGCGGESVRRPAVRPRARRGSVPSRTPLPGTT